MAQVPVGSGTHQGVAFLQCDLRTPVAAQVVARPESQRQAGGGKRDAGEPKRWRCGSKALAQHSNGKPACKHQRSRQRQQQVAGQAGEQAFPGLGSGRGARGDEPIDREDYPQPAFYADLLPSLHDLLLWELSRVAARKAFPVLLVVSRGALLAVKRPRRRNQASSPFTRWRRKFTTSLP